MSKSVKNILITGLLILMNGVLIAQLSVAEMLRYGDLAYDQKNYASAAHFYEMVVDENLKVDRISSHPYAFSVYTGASTKPSKTDSTSSEITEDVDYNELYATHMVAECYRFMNNYQAAHDWYIQALQLNWGGAYEEFVLDRYWYANILMNLGKYNEAIEELESFLLDVSEGSEELTYYVTRSNELIKNCKFAQSSKSKNLDVLVKKGDSLLNNGSSSFGASYYDNSTLLISSARSSSTPDKDRKIEGNLLSDIFTIRSTGKSWEGAISMNDPVNTSEHEGAASIGDDKETMYYTKWYVDNTKLPEIYVSKYFVNRWMKPRLMGESVNEKGYSSQHPYISKDGKLLFFASDRPGGQGGMDIWMCEIDRKGIASNPINLGPNINTPEDEVTPFFHEATGVLYFSSKGHQNIGGFDIFKSKFNLAQKYAARPENMGIPVNSPMNDSYFVLEDLQTSGYFTSNRDDCYDCGGASNCNQIYSIKKNENKFVLSGYVFDFDTDMEIPFANITVKDVLGEFEPYTFQTDSTGYYEIPMAPEMHIFVKAQKLEYLADANVQSTIGKDESEYFTIDFYLKIIPYEEIEIPGILYDYDKATLRPESMVVLDSLVDFLTINDNLIVEISAHTDEQGSDSYNVKLSQKRAESVVEYLISSGIPSERLVAKGYGESIPIVKNAQTEEDHQKNRRTSFRILSEEFEEINQLRPKMK